MRDFIGSQLMIIYIIYGTSACLASAYIFIRERLRYFQMYFRYSVTFIRERLVSIQMYFRHSVTFIRERLIFIQMYFRYSDTFLILVVTVSIITQLILNITFREPLFVSAAAATTSFTTAYTLTTSSAAALLLLCTIS